MPKLKISRTCAACDKPLKAIGTNRTNGRYAGADWDTRSMHVKCWKQYRNTMNCTATLAMQNWLYQQQTLKQPNETINTQTNENTETTQSPQAPDKAGAPAQ